jgi:hypothetical protein
MRLCHADARRCLKAECTRSVIRFRMMCRATVAGLRRREMSRRCLLYVGILTFAAIIRLRELNKLARLRFVALGSILI